MLISDDLTTAYPAGRLCGTSAPAVISTAAVPSEVVDLQTLFSTKDQPTAEELLAPETAAQGYEEEGGD